MESNTDRNRNEYFYNAWKRIGPGVCQKRNIKYVEFNKDLDSKKLKSETVNFILAIDESGSMADPLKWPKVIKNLKTIKNKLCNIKISNLIIKVTTLLLSDTCRIHQSHANVSDVNF